MGGDIGKRLEAKEGDSGKCMRCSLEKKTGNNGEKDEKISLPHHQFTRRLGGPAKGRKVLTEREKGPGS